MSSLRPLRVGERIDASIKAYRARFRDDAIAFLIVAIPAGLIAAPILWATRVTGPLSVTSSVPGQGIIIYWHRVDRVLIGTLSSGAVQAVLTLLASAMVVQIVGSWFVSAPMDWRHARRRAVERLGAVVWVIVLVIVAALAPLAGVVAVGALLALASSLVGNIVLDLGVIGWCVFLVWFAVCAQLTVPIVILENVRGWSTVRRAVRLCRNHWWSVFGTTLLSGLIVFLVGIVGDLVFEIVTNAVGGSAGGWITVTALRIALLLVLTGPFSAIVSVVLLIDLRVRKEGFELPELAAQLGVSPPEAPPAPAAPPSTT